MRALGKISVDSLPKPYGFTYVLTLSNFIDHQILLLKLSIYKCSDESIKWFKSYLLDRNQCTSFKTKVSEKLAIETGVPQGSILGTLLFIVFINDLSMSITNCNVDDSTATATAKTTQELNVQLNQDTIEINTWCSDNHMAANTSKPKAILVTNWQKRPSLPADQQKLSIQMGSENLQNVESENSRYNYQSKSVLG